MRPVARGMLLAAVVVALATPASAQEAEPNKAEAKRLFATGNELLKRDNFDGAVDAYEKAFALLPHALIRYNMGVAQNRKGDPVRAIATLKKALIEQPALSPERKKRAEEIIAENHKRVARVTVHANVDGAEVRVDGVVVGHTPDVELLVGAGQAVMLEARKKGFMPLSQVLRVKAGNTRNLRIELDATELLPAEVRVASQLPGAEVYLDGRLVAVTPLSSTLAVKPNVEHRLELRRDGYTTVVESVKLEPGTEATVAATPTPDPAKSARAVPVVFEVQPTDATVRVDGVLKQGRSVKLMAGLHAVTVERTGYETAMYDLVVPAQGATTVRYDLVPTTETRQAMIDDAVGFRSWGYGLAIGGAVVAATGGALMIFNGAHYADSVAADRAGFDLDACKRAVMPGDSLDGCTGQETAILDSEDRVAALWIAGPILAGLGVVSVASGIVMLATGEDPASFQLDGDELGRITVAPVATFGSGGGFVGVTGTF